METVVLKIPAKWCKPFMQWYLDEQGCEGFLQFLRDEKLLAEDEGIVTWDDDESAFVHAACAAEDE